VVLGGLGDHLVDLRANLLIDDGQSSTQAAAQDGPHDGQCPVGQRPAATTRLAEDAALADVNGHQWTVTPAAHAGREVRSQALVVEHLQEEGRYK
jgi:hypothetical protein